MGLNVSPPGQSDGGLADRSFCQGRAPQGQGILDRRNLFLDRDFIRLYSLVKSFKAAPRFSSRRFNFRGRQLDKA